MKEGQQEKGRWIDLKKKKKDKKEIEREWYRQKKGKEGLIRGGKSALTLWIGGGNFVITDEPGPEN